MSLTKPAQPEFDVDDWLGRPQAERVQAMCETWAMQGFGAPGIAYGFYAIKLVLYVGGFLLFATATTGLDLSNIGDWWFAPIAFEKAVLWTMLFEVMGLGCGSGPLTGRYLPPVTAVAHWLRPGTVRLPAFPKLPLTRGDRRTPVDALLFAAFAVFVVHALLASGQLLPRNDVWPILVLMAVLGLRDKTVFLAARSEHYLIATFVFLFPHDLIQGSKAVQLALWFGAASSKLNHHFPNVIAVMMSNNPFLRSRTMRKALYADYPTDMRGSKLAAGMGHAATVVEYSFPLVLLFTHGGLPTDIALIVMLGFHTNILLSFPMGVPLEWNLFFMYSALTLFWKHASVTAWSIHSPWLGIVLIICLIVIPVLGNVRPDKVSFLPSMRYYAGNWGASLWLWRPGSFEALDGKVAKAASAPRKQLERLYGVPAYELILGRLQAFRSMHLHGRALNSMLEFAIADLDDDDVRHKGVDAFDVVDGELVAGVLLGWNFGDGHLHNEQLLEVVKGIRDFDNGELRCLIIESQPAGKPTMHWRIVDAARGQLAEGHIKVTDLLEMQPWGGRPDLVVAAQGAQLTL